MRISSRSALPMIALLAGLGMLEIGCASASTSPVKANRAPTHGGTITTCSLPFVAVTPTEIVGLGTCASLLGATPPDRIALAVGQSLTLHPAIKGIHFARPYSSERTVLRRTKYVGGEATFLAEAPGTATVLVPGAPCAQPNPMACPAATIVVSPDSPKERGPEASSLTKLTVVRTPGHLVLPSLTYRITDSQAAQRIVADIRTLPQFPAAERCPADFGTSYALTFMSAAGASWTATVSAQGCQVVDVSNERLKWALHVPKFWQDMADALNLTVNQLLPTVCQSSSQQGCVPNAP